MALQEICADSGSRRSGPEHTPRLRLKRKGRHTGFVDGAWWPHSEVLTTELGDLLAVLSVRLGDVARVTYNITEWTNTPRRVSMGGRIVRLDGYHRQPANTMGILDASGNAITLLVVPARTEPDRAHGIVMAAAATENESSVAALLS